MLVVLLGSFLGAALTSRAAQLKMAAVLHTGVGSMEESAAGGRARKLIEGRGGHWSRGGHWGAQQLGAVEEREPWHEQLQEERLQEDQLQEQLPDLRRAADYGVGRAEDMAELDHPYAYEQPDTRVDGSGSSSGSSGSSSGSSGSSSGSRTGGNDENSTPSGPQQVPVYVQGRVSSKFGTGWGWGYDAEGSNDVALLASRAAGVESCVDGMIVMWAMVELAITMLDLFRRQQHAKLVRYRTLQGGRGLCGLLGCLVAVTAVQGLCSLRILAWPWQWRWVADRSVLCCGEIEICCILPALLHSP
jgi:hypothetical protein